MSHYDLETKCLHSGYTPKKGEPCALPIYQSTTFKYDSKYVIKTSGKMTRSNLWRLRLKGIGQIILI